MIIADVVAWFGSGVAGPAMTIETSSPPGLLERTFAVLAMLLLTGHLLPYLAHEGPGPIVGAERWPPQLLLAYGSIYAVAGLLLLLHLRTAWAMAIRDPWLLALTALALLSLLWSGDPLISLRRVLGLLGTLLVAVYIVRRYPLREWVELLLWALGIGAGASIALVLVAPELGIHGGYNEEAWRGIFLHKNELGRLMVVGLLAAGAYIASGKGRPSWATAIALLMFALVVLSGSRTAWVLLALLVLASAALAWLGRSDPDQRRTIVLIIAGVLALVAALAVTFGDAALATLNRDASLTGRIPLWVVLWEHVLARPWLGHGYGGFWVQSAGSPAASVWATVGWTALTAHNGYLELQLQLGVIGLALFSASLARTGTAAWRLASRAGDAFSSVPLLLLVLLVALNIVESFVLRHNSLLWALYIMIALTLPGRESQE